MTKRMLITKKKSKMRINGKMVTHIIFIVFFALSVIVPLIMLFTNMTSDGIKTVFESKLFLPSLFNSITTALTSTVISVVLAIVAAYCVERSGIRATSLWSVIFVIPMLIPSISHAFGIITLFGQNGVITNALHIGGNIYGFVGIVLGSVMYSFPVAFLMISSILRYEDGMSYKAARVLGIPLIRRITSITLPYLKKTLISTFFAVFTMIITDYGVPLAVGGQMSTLASLMYNTAVANSNYNNGSVIGVILLIPAVAAFIVDLVTSDKTSSGFVVESVDKPNRLWIKIVSYCFCAFLSLFVLLPIIAFCVMSFATKYPVNMTFTFEHIFNTIERGAGTQLLYSMLYALLTTVIGVIIGFLCAYSTSRMKGKLSKVVHLLAMISMAVPGIVLGLSYLLFFSKSFIYGTVFIIVMVNTIHFFSSPYLMMYNTLSKVNAQLEDVGASLGIPKFRIILNVILPKVLPTLLEMAVYFFVNMMMTISAVSFLAPPAPKPLALMINQFESQLLMENAAFVSLLILFVNILIKGSFAIYRRISSRRDVKA